MRIFKIKKIFSVFTLNNHILDYSKLSCFEMCAGLELVCELYPLDRYNSYFCILDGHNTISAFYLHPSPRFPLAFQFCFLLGLAFGQTSNQNLCVSLWVYFLLEKTHSYKNHDSLTSWGQLPDQYQSEWEAHDGCPFGLKQKQQRHIKLS